MTDGSLDIVFFDAGGTLIHPEPLVGTVYADVGARHGARADPETLARAFREAFRRKRRQGLVQDRQWWREVVDWTFGPFGPVTDPDGLFHELYEHFARSTAWALVPGARSVLRELRGGGIRTGLISNWDDRLPALLDGLGIADGLEPRVISCEAGREKPDPRLFELALERAGVEAGRALMVGDDPDADVAGARRAGLRAVRLGSRFDPPDEIDRLDRLLEILGPRTGAP